MDQTTTTGNDDCDPLALRPLDLVELDQVAGGGGNASSIDILSFSFGCSSS